MTKLIYDADIDASALDGQTVAVIGYGSQGEAHARNLAESGVDVVVGLRPDSSSADRARDRRQKRHLLLDVARQGAHDKNADHQE